jgi:cell division protein DivIC
MNILSRIVTILRNKYLLALTCFVVWMLFCDRDDLFTQMERRHELAAIRESKDFYAERIKEDRNFSKDLQFNASAIEKLGREKYLMKRDNEDLFLIQPLEKK